MRATLWLGWQILRAVRFVALCVLVPFFLTGILAMWLCWQVLMVARLLGLFALGCLWVLARLSMAIWCFCEVNTQRDLNTSERALFWCLDKSKNLLFRFRPIWLPLFPPAHG